MVSLVLGAPPISSQSLTVSSCKSFSRSETLGASFSAHSASSLSISTTIPLPTVPPGNHLYNSLSLSRSLDLSLIFSLYLSWCHVSQLEQLHKAQFIYLLLGRNEGFRVVEDTSDAKVSMSSLRELWFEVSKYLNPSLGWGRGYITWRGDSREGDSRCAAPYSRCPCHLPVAYQTC